MTQIPDLLNDFDTAMSAIAQRLNDPKVSETEQNLTQELSQTSLKMATLEASLEEYKSNFQNMSQEYGEMELALKALQDDNSAQVELDALTKKMDALKATSEEKMAQLRVKNDELQTKLVDTTTAAADMEIAFKSSQSDAMDEIKQQHSQDIAQVQTILNQLKPLVEE